MATAEYRETVFSHDTDMEPGVFCVDTSESWSINMVKKLKAKYPDDVEIRQNKDGSITAYMPLKWMRIRPPAKRELTDEQRVVLSERMRGLNRKQSETQQLTGEQRPNLNETPQR